MSSKVVLHGVTQVSKKDLKIGCWYKLTNPNSAISFKYAGNIKNRSYFHYEYRYVEGINYEITLEDRLKLSPNTMFFEVPAPKYFTFKVIWYIFMGKIKN